MKPHSFEASDLAAMDRLGRALASTLAGSGAVLHLTGELGAGKTTLVRATLRGLGVTGAVRSPTYTLVEGYALADGMAWHLDLYRIRGVEELEYLGIRELDATSSRVFVEWPERAAGGLPVADLGLKLSAKGEGREVVVQARSSRGERILAGWQDALAKNTANDAAHTA
ncbi:MAG TPA: tRNA (adenosine(37)-N6)-threonylcarbamoyltransferase complex ATPase subunit type 1 TsaE [Gammaproteobacteria bacterium]|nr:tRNA (adenosine(37)-N6)-threonylcarbamoyltransferase complex ATPase subunit type 1 TsaE [Gammaproteobacteria bacterium]